MSRMPRLLAERTLAVSGDPDVELFVAETRSPGDRTLLVVHGGPDWDHTYLIDPVHRLGDGWRIVWPDLRGCGRSTRGLSTDQYTPDAVVADLVTLLERLQLPVVDVLGFSFGGCIAQRLALAEPSRVRRLVVASSTMLAVPPDAYDDWAERKHLAEAVNEVWSRTGVPAAELTRAAAQAGADMAVWRQESRIEWQRRLGGISFSGEWLRAWRDGSLRPALPEDAPRRLSALEIPILVLHGRQDMTFPADLAGQAAAQMPMSRCRVLEDAGHMAHVDQPEEWLAAVREFLAGGGRLGP